MGKGKYDEIKEANDDRSTLMFFTILTILTQIVGFIMVVLCGSWMGNYRGGFSWKDPKLEFNFHPLFMTLGMIFLYGDAILIYRVFRNTEKLYVKIAHGILQVLVLIFASISLKAVFDSHNLAQKPIPNMYSLHSWIGLTSIILFSLQWVCGFVSFLYPKLSENLRKWYLPSHRLWGIIIFVMCCAAALMGITEKAIFTLSSDYSNLPSEAKLLNVFGVFIAIYCGLVVYLVTKFDYRRPPESDRIPLSESTTN